MGTSLRLPEPSEAPGHAANAEAPVVGVLLSWYAGAARELPWRDRGAGAWAVLVSEIMLQQTPVARVQPAYTEWLARWPTPAALAAAAPGDAVRAWGRLGYPRRALRLQRRSNDDRRFARRRSPLRLRGPSALPGVGDYTAAAIAAFAFRQRHVVLDTKRQAGARPGGIRGCRTSDGSNGCRTHGRRRVVAGRR